MSRSHPGFLSEFHEYGDCMNAQLQRSKKLVNRLQDITLRAFVVPVRSFELSERPGAPARRTACIDKNLEVLEIRSALPERRPKF